MSEPDDKKVVEFPRGKPVRSYEAGEREAIRDDGEDQRVKDLIAKTDEALKARNFPEVARLALELEGAQRDRRIALTGVADIFKPLPPVNYLVAALDLCPGAPALAAGYGFAGKTMIAQALAVAIASGQPVFGCLSGRRGRVVHLDYEQGERLTSERYQRLAAGLQLNPGDLDGNLSVATLPRFYLDQSGAESVLRETLEGADLCIIDSLRACAPTVDENSSEVRLVLDTLTRVSEATGCVCLVIHHSRKPQQNAQGGARMAIRGSGAIYDACSSVLVLEAEKGKPTRIFHEKARTSGRLAEDMILRIEDVEIPGEPMPGLSVRVEAAPKYSPPDALDNVEQLQAAVLEFVADNPGATKTRVRAAGLGRHKNVDLAVSILVEDGKLTQTRGPHGAIKLEVNSVQE